MKIFGIIFILFICSLIIYEVIEAVYWTPPYKQIGSESDVMTFSCFCQECDRETDVVEKSDGFGIKCKRCGAGASDIHVGIDYGED